MNLMIIELWRIGAFESVVNFSNPRISGVFWFFVLTGAAIQHLTLKKCASRMGKYSPVWVAAVTAVACEVLCQTMAGSVLFGWLTVYVLDLALLVGALIRVMADLIHRMILK